MLLMPLRHAAMLMLRYAAADTLLPLLIARYAAFEHCCCLFCHT